MTSHVVSVGLLSSYIRQIFESDPILSDIWVEGEVAEVFVSRAGHVYFTLRDGQSQIKAVMFKGMAIRQRVSPAAGDQVVAHGKVSTYERDGTYQLIADVLERAGTGVLALQFERLRQQLDAEGLFEETRKRELPAFPRKVGVVTSEQGAVWHDIQTVFRRRYPIVELVLAPAAVQGDRAPASLIQAIERLQTVNDLDLIIIARGGGSAEDLAAFNDESLARAVFACRIPVISAIGHETDWSIIDFVADVRAATPTAAAELASPSLLVLFDQLRECEVRSKLALREAIRDRQTGLSYLDRRLEQKSPVDKLRTERTAVCDLKARCARGITDVVALRRTELGGQTAIFQLSLRATLELQRSRLAIQSSVLAAIGPRATLGRGYALLERADSAQPVMSVASLCTGESFVATMWDGRIRATVDATTGVGHND